MCNSMRRNIWPRTNARSMLMGNPPWNAAHNPGDAECVIVHHDLRKVAFSAPWWDAAYNRQTGTKTDAIQ